MEVTKLKRLIQEKTLPSFLIFTGDEWKVQSIYINEISRLFSKKVYLENSVDILEKLKSPSFLSRETLYIVRDDKAFMADEKLQKQILSMLNKNMLILMLSSVDRRTKFYKTYCESFIEFSLLEHAVLKRYVKREINLSDKNIDLLMELCEYNYGRCLLEIDKIRRYALLTYPEVGHEDESGDYNRAIDDLLEDGTIYEPPYDAVFDFVDEVLKCHVNKAFNLLEQCYAVNEATLVILTNLYNVTKQVLQVQSCRSSDIESTTGLTSWQIKKAKEKVNYRSVEELVSMLKLIRTVEKGIKTGQIEEKYAVQYILANVL